jgi:multidrug transporter EmrE-like cation transporter
MGIFFAFIAALFVPITNLFLRKSVDAGGNAKAFFVFELGVSCLLAMLMYPVATCQYRFDWPVILMGAVAGVILSGMLSSLGKAVEKGPPGITFCILNSATVMPGLLMAVIFGAAKGYDYTVWHAIGSSLVVLGLFWAGKGVTGMDDKKQWVIFSTATFIFHMLLLTLYQWRAMLLNLPNPQEVFSFISAEQIQCQWFTPAMFFTAGLIQLVVYLQQEDHQLKLKEAILGSAGGISNILCTFFVIRSTEVASPLENAIIFPIFSVVGILLTNAWGQALYQEKVNWKACQLCVLGLIVGTVDWKAVATALGW